MVWYVYMLKYGVFIYCKKDSFDTTTKGLLSNKFTPGHFENQLSGLIDWLDSV